MLQIAFKICSAFEITRSTLRSRTTLTPLQIVSLQHSVNSILRKILQSLSIKHYPNMHYPLSHSTKDLSDVFRFTICFCDLEMGFWWDRFLSWQRLPSWFFFFFKMVIQYIECFHNVFWMTFSVESPSIEILQRSFYQHLFRFSFDWRWHTLKYIMKDIFCSGSSCLTQCFVLPFDHPFVEHTICAIVSSIIEKCCHSPVSHLIYIISIIILLHHVYVITHALLFIIVVLTSGINCQNCIGSSMLLISHCRIYVVRLHIETPWSATDYCLALNRAEAVKQLEKADQKSRYLHWQLCKTEQTLLSIFAPLGRASLQLSPLVLILIDDKVQWLTLLPAFYQAKINLCI